MYSKVNISLWALLLVFVVGTGGCGSGRKSVDPLVEDAVRRLFVEFGWSGTVTNVRVRRIEVVRKHGDIYHFSCSVEHFTTNSPTERITDEATRRIRFVRIAEPANRDPM